MFSGLADTAIMYGAIDLLRLNDIFVKITANVLVIILNYSFSKHIVFKDKDQGEVIL
jgi:putative flippase GtrA